VGVVRDAPSCALLGGFAIGARFALLWQHNANPSYKLASIARYDDIVRTLGRVCARCWPVTGGWRGRSQNCAPYMGSGRGWLAADGRRRGGVLDITAAAWTAGLQWWRSGNITQTQNVSEYMLVLALCLVTLANNGSGWPSCIVNVQVWQVGRRLSNEPDRGLISAYTICVYFYEDISGCFYPFVNKIELSWVQLSGGTRWLSTKKGSETFSL